MIRRPALLLSAAVTVAVPGMLAVIAVFAQHAVGQPASAAMATLPGDPISPTAPGVPAPVRDALAGTQYTLGEPVTAMSPATSGQRKLGMRLLGKAADASQTRSYSGVEVLSQSGVDGTVTMVSHVWHRGGGLTVTQTSSAASRSAPRTAVSYDPNNRSPEGVFGLTGPLVALLVKHYVAIYQGVGSTLGRPAAIVAVYRFDGSLAARFWLDSQTLVPLRRELFTRSEKVISEEAFVQVRFGKLTAQPAIASSAQALPGPAWVKVTSPGGLVASLAGQGLRVPDTLPGGLPLFAVQSSGTGAGQVVALEYSDGLYVDSLFVQRGSLAPQMTGWRSLRLDDHQVYAAGRSVTWAGNGSVYTMVADAPPNTVARAVAALPPSSPPGFLGRLGRGLARLAHLMNPFG